MANKAAFLRVGFLVVFGIAATVGVTLFLGRNQVRGGQKYETYFKESVQGLDIGASIKYRGVTLGQVTDIALVSAAYPDAMPADNVKDSYQLVMIRFDIDPAKLGVVPEQSVAVAQGLRARLASQGLTGLAYVELDFVDPVKFPPLKVPWTPREFYIPSMPSTVSQVQDGLTVVLDRLKGVDYAGFASSVQSVLDDAHAQMTTGDLHQILADTAAVTKTLRKVVDDAHLEETAADLRAAAAGLRQVAQGKDAQGLIAKASAAADQFTEAARKLPALLAALQGSVRRADDGMADIGSALTPVLRDARAAAANLRDTSEALRRYPAATLLGGPPPKEGAGR